MRQNRLSATNFFAGRGVCGGLSRSDEWRRGAGSLAMRVATAQAMASRQAAPSGTNT